MLSSYRSSTPWLPAILWLGAALIVQTEILGAMTLGNLQLSIVLVLVVWFAVRTDLRSAAFFALIAGACEDIFSTQTGAAWTIATLLTAVSASLVSRGFFADSIPLLAGIVVLATLFRRLIFWIVMALQGYPAGYAGLHFHQALWESLVNGAFTVVAFTLIRLWRVRSRRA